MTQPRLTSGEILDMRSVLLRSLQRAERRRAAFPDDPKAVDEAEELARAVADLDDELAGIA